MKALLWSLRWLVFAVAVLALNFPLIAVLVASFKTDAEIGDNPSLFIRAPTLANYRHIFAIGDRFDISH